jgi:hypothetical protein
MAFEHPSGLASTYDRADSDAARARLVWPEGAYLQGADLNELQSLEARRNRRIGDMVARDGDRIAGGEIIIDRAAGSALLAAGRIYVRGDVRPVAAATLTGVDMVGEALIGVRLVTTTTTYLDDPTLLGLEPGSAAEGQPGAARQRETIVWARSGDGGAGDFYPVYRLVDGTPIDQSPPPTLSGVTAVVAAYDRDSHGSYIVSGCEVTALGKVGDDQVYSIQAGTANIQGFKFTRGYALRHAQTEDPDLEIIVGEPQTVALGAGAVLKLNRGPIASVDQVIIVKETTESVTRGSSAGGSDALGRSSIVSIVSIAQGGTTFAAASYVLSSDQVSWAPAGAEPAAGSTYSVTYRYNTAVTPDAVGVDNVTVSGAVAGTTALIGYRSKLPRIDLLCLTSAGTSTIVRGVSAREDAVPPRAPSALLKLAEVWHSWRGAPSIFNNGTHSAPYDVIARLIDRVDKLQQEVDRSNMERAIAARDPVGRKGTFTDAFRDDSYRDEGEAQTAAIVDGVLQLAISTVSVGRFVEKPISLDYVEEVIIRQELATAKRKINPFANFDRMPAGLTLKPAVDYWTDHRTQWASAETREFGEGGRVNSTTTTESLGVRTEIATTCRQIPIDWSLAGFGAGEILDVLTFDGVSVRPATAPVADAAGKLSGAFTIPPNIPTGTRRVRAEGRGGSFGEALFHSEGTISTQIVRRVTLVTRWVERERSDPLAESFTPPEARHIVGIDFKLAVIGDPTRVVRVQLRDTENGYPSSRVVAEAIVEMTGRVVGEWVKARFAAPIYRSADREYAFVLMTDDNAHAVWFARLGDFDAGLQIFVAAQPYTVGVMFESANSSTWSAVQDADLTFRIVAAKFTQTTKTVNIGTMTLSQVSDLVARGTIDVPTDDAAFRFEVVRANGDVIRLAPNQPVSLASYITETVTLRAVLTGTEKISPVLYPGAALVAGRLRTEGSYISKVFRMDGSSRISAVIEASLPAGSSMQLSVDAGDDAWSAMTQTSSEQLRDGWNEPKFDKTGFSAPKGRVRVVLAGDPSARPGAARLRAYSAV